MTPAGEPISSRGLYLYSLLKRYMPLCLIRGILYLISAIKKRKNHDRNRSAKKEIT